MPSQDGDDAGTGPDIPTGRRDPVFSRVVVLAFLGLLLVVLGTNSMGSLSASPRFEIGQIERVTPTVQSPRAADPGVPTQLAQVPEESDDSVLPLVVLLTAAAILITGVALLIQSAVRIKYSNRKDPWEEDKPDGDIVPQVAEEDLSSFRQHFDEAEAALLDEDASANAIIQCWLALERAASLAGRGRRLSETPSEFTAVVLRAFDTDPADIQLLLRFYHRARYGVRAQRAAMSEREVAEVRQALGSLRRDIEEDLSVEKTR